MLLGLWDTKGSQNPVPKTNQVIINKKKITYHQENFAVPADHREKTKKKRKD